MLNISNISYIYKTHLGRIQKVKVSKSIVLQVTLLAQFLVSSGKMSVFLAAKCCTMFSNCVCVCVSAVSFVELFLNCSMRSANQIVNFKQQFLHNLYK